MTVILLMALSLSEIGPPEHDPPEDFKLQPSRIQDDEPSVEINSFKNDDGPYCPQDRNLLDPRWKDCR